LSGISGSSTAMIGTRVAACVTACVQFTVAMAWRSVPA
jgi:hypothetical protein